MTHIFKIDLKENTIYETFSGDIDLKSLSDANASIRHDRSFKEGLNILTDLQKCHINFGFDEMYSHVVLRPNLNTRKQVFVVKNEKEFGMVRMYIALASEDDGGAGSEANVFYDMKEARAWLNL